MFRYRVEFLDHEIRRANSQANALQFVVGRSGGAHQSFAQECDINEIVRRFGLTGELPPARRAPEYGDFSQVVDFQTAMEQLVIAQAAFEELPAEVRREFGNDPAYFVDWISDPANAGKAAEFGLLSVVPPGEPAVQPAGGESVGNAP